MLPGLRGTQPSACKPTIFFHCPAKGRELGKGNFRNYPPFTAVLDRPVIQRGISVGKPAEKGGGGKQGFGFAEPKHRDAGGEIWAENGPVPGRTG